MTTNRQPLMRRITGGDEPPIAEKKKEIRLYILPCISFGRGSRGLKRVRFFVTVILPLFVVTIMSFTTFTRNNAASIITIGHDSSSSISTPLYDMYPVPRLKTFHEYPKIKRDVMFIPFQNKHRAPITSCPRAVLFIFHGCNRYAASFFYSPQGRQIVAMAHNAGLSVVTFRKTNELGCWDTETDAEAILKIGRKFMTSKLKDTTCTTETDSDGNAVYPPVWAFGASSGGQFIMELAARMKEDPASYWPFVFSAMNVQIMVPINQGEALNIPTIFTVMEGDPSTKRGVQDMLDYRAAQQQHSSSSSNNGTVPLRMITTSGQKGIHPQHFYNLYADDKRMTKELSLAIYQDLITNNIINPTNNIPSMENHLLVDPRLMVEQVTSVWTKYITAQRTIDKKDILASPPFGVTYSLMRSLRAEEMIDADSLWLIEELNVAYDVHEVTAEGFQTVLEFFSEYGHPEREERK